MIPAIDYTPPVNTPAVIQVDYCDSTRLDTTWHPGWVPVIGSAFFCPTAAAEPMFTNPRPVPPATVTGQRIPAAPAPEIGDAVMAYPTENGTIVVVRIGGSTRRFVA